MGTDPFKKSITEKIGESIRAFEQVMSNDTLQSFVPEHRIIGCCVILIGKKCRNEHNLENDMWSTSLHTYVRNKRLYKSFFPPTSARQNLGMHF